MATSRIKGLDEQLLEGGAGGGGMGRGSSTQSKQGLSINSQAAKNAAKNNASTADEMIKLDKMLESKKELAQIKSKPERQAAERNAVTKEEGGVKTTIYPYAGPNEYKKGGITASSRADGVAERGKTRGKIC